MIKEYSGHLIGLIVAVIFFLLLAYIVKPSSESLKDTLFRIKPLLDSVLFPKIINGDNVMVVAHGNSLRAIVKILKNLSNEEVIKLNIPTGAPYMLHLDSKLKVRKDYYLGNKQV